jgi:hypothetical protein
MADTDPNTNNSYTLDSLIHLMDDTNVIPKMN